MPGRGPTLIGGRRSSWPRPAASAMAGIFRWRCGLLIRRWQGHRPMRVALRARRRAASMGSGPGGICRFRGGRALRIARTRHLSPPRASTLSLGRPPRTCIGLPMPRRPTRDAGNRISSSAARCRCMAVCAMPSLTTRTPCDRADEHRDSRQHRRLPAGARRIRGRRTRVPAGDRLRAERCAGVDQPRRGIVSAGSDRRCRDGGRKGADIGRDGGGDGEALCNVGMYLASAGDPDAAISLYERVLPGAPDPNLHFAFIPVVSDRPIRRRVAAVRVPVAQDAAFQHPRRGCAARVERSGICGEDDPASPRARPGRHVAFPSLCAALVKALGPTVLLQAQPLLAALAEAVPGVNRVVDASFQPNSTTGST